MAAGAKTSAGGGGGGLIEQKGTGGEGLSFEPFATTMNFQKAKKSAIALSKEKGTAYRFTDRKSGAYIVTTKLPKVSSGRLMVIKYKNGKDTMKDIWIPKAPPAM